MAAGAEVITDGAEDRQEGLHVLGRLEALQYSLSPANGKVRILSPIVRAFVATVIDVGQDPPDGWRVTRELVGDHDSRLGANTVDDFAQEAFGGKLITSRLDQDVEHDSMLVHGAPQPVAMTADADRYFVEMPLIAGSRSSSTKLQREGGSELGTPAPYGLIADLNAEFSHEFLDVAEAQIEAKVQPDRMGDDLGWVAMSAVERDGAESTADRTVSSPLP